MTSYWRSWKWLVFMLILLSLVSSSLVAAAPIPDPPDSGAVVARVYYRDQDDLNRLAGLLDIWEVHHAEGYLVAMLPGSRYEQLAAEGYVLVVDEEKTALLGRRNELLPGQVNGIPGYECYRTVEETYASLGQMESNHPDLVEIIDIGDSWDKTWDGGPAGYDLLAVKLTNEANNITEKPRFFLMAEVHAREYTTSETATRFAELLLDGYGVDPDFTWLLDYFEVYILPVSNPDGRKFAETGVLWRKNTNNSNGCTSYPNYGTDLNRNSSFKWELGIGTTDNACGETYRGPSNASEPETQALQDFMASIFLDQRGPGDTDSAPATTTGLMISLHSYSPLVLYPWGWTSAQAPNRNQLRTLGRKFGYYNQYDVCQSGGIGCIYQTSGSNDDWAYGELGIAAYTYEMGNEFHQLCQAFEGTVWPRNRDALRYAVKSARLPYMNPAGPEIITTAASITALTDVIPVSATADDTRFKNSLIWGNEPTQAIAEARYSVDMPSWQPNVVLAPMTASDGSFNSTIEGIRVNLDTTGWAVGRYLVFMEARDAANPANWGVPTGLFVDVPDFVFTATVVPGMGFGIPGQAVEYHLTLTNTGTASDSFSITTTSSLGWLVTAPAFVGPVNPGASVDALISVAIPPDYAGADVNLTGLKIIPQGANQRSRTVVFSTSVQESHLYLPSIGK